MFRIRFHGRGGQGIKTASRLLGTAFFTAGFQVQDAPRYGAERRGAPVFAYVRAARAPINERGVIPDPDLVAVADDSLLGIPAAGVCQGLTARAVLLLVSHEPAEIWRHRLNLQGPVLVLPPVAGGDVEQPHAGAACAGAAAQLVGVITRDALLSAIREELAGMPPQTLNASEAEALAAFDTMRPHAGLAQEGDGQPATAYRQPGWVSLPFEEARISAPAIHGGLTSVEVRTGLWRTMRPVIDYDRCNHCWWVCSTFCPDSAIRVEDNRPVIDYDHCKGCMICVAKCPPHAIAAFPEHEAQREERAAGAA